MFSGGKRVPAVIAVDLTGEEATEPALPSLPQDLTAKEIPTST